MKTKLLIINFKWQKIRSGVQTAVRPARTHRKMTSQEEVEEQHQQQPEAMEEDDDESYGPIPIAKLEVGIIYLEAYNWF